MTGQAVLVPDIKEEYFYARFGQLLGRDFYSGYSTFSAFPYKKHPLQDENGAIRCYGRIQPYAEGTPLRVEGKEDGGRFTVSSCYIPTDTAENTVRLIHFISSDFSEAQASAIAAAARNNLFAFIKRPDCMEILLQALSRSGKKEQLAAMLVNRLQSISQGESLFYKLIGFDVPYDRAWKLVESGVSAEMLAKRPYQYFSRYDVPLHAADRYAREECGFHAYSIQRLSSYIKDVLDRSLSAGNTCVPFEFLAWKTDKMLKKASAEGSGMGAASMSPALLCYCLSRMGNYCSVHTLEGKSYVYINHVWDEETVAAHHMGRLQQDRKQIRCTPDIPAIEKELGITYNAGQRQAFELLTTSGVKILTGPPGSGKTALIRGLVMAFQSCGLGTVRLAATTGMAAKVMTAACGIEEEEKSATTLHLMLGIRPFENGAVSGKTLSDPVDTDFIIVDEVSMLDLQMFSCLLSAVRNGAILLLVGDKDQLESVGYGNVLSDLLSSGMVETYSLIEILRQHGSSISENAAKINQGRTDVVCGRSFSVIECDSDEEAGRRLFQEVDGKNVADYTLLSPLKAKGVLSAAGLNRVIQAMNPNLDRSRSFEYGGKHFYVNDKVITLKNEYEKGYVNGDTGYIADISRGTMTVFLPNGVRTLDQSDLCNMDLAYAVTVHKSQGSECNTVYVMLPGNAENMLSRRLLYTAVTRAKEKVVVYSVNGGFKKAVRNNKDLKRVTLLGKRLANPHPDNKP